ncbi:hypothetical protein IWW55_004034 [Coemansia sp. RSA 2706]|nr:hypothetical protein IWW55_004034 [Coemansia sp. RSA 2706]
MHRLNFRSDAIIHPQVASVRSNASASESANSFATAGTTAGHAAGIVAGIVILGLSTHEVSKQPLRVFVILHIVRLFLYYPLYVTHQLLRHLLDVCSVVLFIAGNHWVFSGKTDNATAPLLHYLSLTYIILGYLYVSLPLLLLFFLFVIFSVFYVFSPDFRMRMHEKKGAKLGQILQIPLVRFADTRLAARTTPHSSPPSLHGDRRSDGVGPGPAEADIAAMPAASQSAASLHEQAARRRPGLSHIHFFNPFARAVRRLTRSRRQRETEAEMYKNQLAGPVPDFMPRDADDCTCAICLDDYKDGAILRLLPCGHHMHQACVDEWLHINQTCPLCKQSAVSGELQAQETSPAAHEASAPGCVDAAATAGEPALAAPAPVH